MSTEIRFLLAVVLMIAVLVVSNLLFPPAPMEEPEGPQFPDSVLVQESPEGQGPVDEGPSEELVIPTATEPELAGGQDEETAVAEGGIAEEESSSVVVAGPLYTFEFSTRGGRLRSARMVGFSSFNFEGDVELIHPGGAGALGSQVRMGEELVDLRNLDFEAEPAQGLRLEEGGSSQSLLLTYQHPSHPFRYEVTYTFQPDSYVVHVSGKITGVDADQVYVDLGTGIPFNEQRDQDEERASAYVVNHLQEGIQAQQLNRVDADTVEAGPFLWVAFKSKYFVTVLLAGDGEVEEAYLGGVLVESAEEEYEAGVTATQPVGGEGAFDFRLFMGPQEYERLANLGADMQNVNPYGWKFFRPIVRPFVGIIMTVLVFLHENLNLTYGWVLIIFGVLMRVVLFPLNQKGMKAQMRNMAVQPLMQEIQAKYKDQPEKLQKEMMKLYKEHGFNPLAGCLPMLLPWPVLIALFFVFQNTIELRGVSFLWLPDLSAPDPYYILPAFLGISMFLLQWVSMRSMPQQNSQMKMMMYVMPVMMVFIFFQLASGLNLYYSTANIATLPQQIYIAKERKKAQAKTPLTLNK